MIVGTAFALRLIICELVGCGGLKFETHNYN